MEMKCNGMDPQWIEMVSYAEIRIPWIVSVREVQSHWSASEDGAIS